MPARKLILTAYIDPSLGSMLLQTLAGILIASAVMGRRLLMAPLEWLHLLEPHQRISRKTPR
jgi:hypothetical protein